MDDQEETRRERERERESILAEGDKIPGMEINSPGYGSGRRDAVTVSEGEPLIEGPSGRETSPPLSDHPRTRLSATLRT